MKTNDGAVLARGSWYSKKDCPNNPTKGLFCGYHIFEDTGSKPGLERGVRLVSAKCKHCGGLILDAPAINC